jgi:hypothetical protein
MLILSGVLFFELRSKQYAQATANQASAHPIKVSTNRGIAAAIAEPSKLKLINAKIATSDVHYKLNAII